MSGGKFSEANLFGMTIRESANDGSDFTNPDADYRRLFLGEDGLLHLRDSAGTVTTPSAGAASLDALLALSSGQDIADALSGAAAPDAGNVFATMADVGVGGASATSAALKAAYIQSATNGTTHNITIAAAASGDRIIVCVSSRGRDVNAPTCTNTTFTEVMAATFGNVFLSVYVGVVAGGASGTTISVTATGSNWIITDTYVVLAADLTPTAGTPSTVTNTDAGSIAGTTIGPITTSLGDFFVFAVTDDDGTSSFTNLRCSSPLFIGATGASGVALMSGIGRAGATRVAGYFNGGTTGSDFAAGIVSIT